METDKDLIRIKHDYKARQKMVVLTMDEIYICEGVVYDKHNGRIIGFTDLGDITNHLVTYIDTRIICHKI